MKQCSPQHDDGGPVLRLPVLAPGTKPGPIRRSRNGPRRAAVLIAVHLLFLLHLTHWLLRGETVSPVEPSESMRTLELGEVNAGAVFFALALLSTLIFGRFFCGWGCHIVALQDLCGWIMKKCGVRPKPFRTRLLILLPLIFALYMFVWPTFKRLVLGPLLRPAWPDIDRALNITAFPDEGFTNHLMTEGFWDTFAAPAVAVPFLLICGFAVVYFLGAKGFCTYGCPYGGFFAPLDSLAPGRIVVDHDKCHQCGHCTAVCTSNVRVHEEIREYGSVIDPGCMKCMDCVSVCPNDALSFGFVRPAVAKGKPRNKAPKRVYDTSIREELALGAAFTAVFFAWRGAYATVPMLMAVGIALCALFVVWKAWRMLRDRDVRLSVFQLKRAGCITRAGAAFATAAAIMLAATAHTGAVNFLAWRGNAAYEALAIPKQRVLLPNQPPMDDETVARARAGARWFDLAAGVRDGGIALATPAAHSARHALLLLATGQEERAERMLLRVVEQGRADDELVADVGRLMLKRGDPRAAENLYARRLAEKPGSWAVREEWAMLMARSGRIDEALKEARHALDQLPPERFTRTPHARTRLTLARLNGALGRTAEALDHLRAAVEVRPNDPVLRENLAAALYQTARDLPGAIEQMQAAVAASPANPERRTQLGRLLLEAGRADEAVAAFEEVLRRAPDDADRREVIARMLGAAGRPEDAARLRAR